MTEEIAKPQHLIGGQWIDGNGSDSFAVYNPARGEQVAELTSASEADVDDAVSAAAEAFPAWSAMSLQRRVQFLYKMRQNLLDNVESLGRILSLDQGKTLAEAQAEVGRAAEVIETAIAMPMLYHNKSGNVARGIDARHIRTPLGVCAAITPLNFPVMNPSQFSAWALVTGNTLVLKASETDPLASTGAIRLFQAVGLPDGVLNLVHGGADVAKALIAHPTVRAVSGITSSPVAKAIYEQATALGKRVQANGGAKNPIVVADDADLDLAAEGIVSSAFGMAGQRCLAGTRIVAQSPIYDKLVEKVAELADKLVLGAGLDPETTMGPVVTAASKKRLVDAIDAAESYGATIVRDGRNAEPVTASATADGYFVAPTIITGLPTTEAPEHNELFGPVIVVHRAENHDEALDIANNTDFGNAATIYTTSGSVAAHYERGLQAGNIGVNTFPAPPFNFTMGGLGESFYGESHICGDAPMDFYTENKLVVTRW